MGVVSAAFVGILTVATASGQAVLDYVSTVQGTSGLLGYWRFDAASQANSLVNGYTGSFQGNAAVGSTGAGPALAIDSNNTPLVLDGSGDYVQTSLTGNITGAGSVTSWVYLTVQPGTTGHIFQITSQSQVGNDFDFSGSNG